MKKKNSKREIGKQPENRCEAKARNGSQCGKVKGFGTDHLGRGKCKFHGGNTPSPTHIVTIGSFDEKVIAYQEQADIFDLRKDIAILRTVRDEEVENFKTSDPGSVERDNSIMKLNSIISSIVRSVDKFHTLLRREHFALTIDQARQIRDGMKRIIGEEAIALIAILEPASPELAEPIRLWSARVSERLNTELTLEEEPSADAVKGLN